MNTIKPGALLLACLGFAAFVVPAGTAIWLRGTNSFLVTYIGSPDGQPRDIPTGWIFVILGLAAAVVYAIPAGLAFVALRRVRRWVRNVVTLAILPLALGVAYAWAVIGCR